MKGGCANGFGVRLDGRMKASGVKAALGCNESEEKEKKGGNRCDGSCRME